MVASHTLASAGLQVLFFVAVQFISERLEVIVVCEQFLEEFLIYLHLFKLVRAVLNNMLLGFIAD